MVKKNFNVVLRNNENDFEIEGVLAEVSGYFKTLSANPVFVYFNIVDRNWYVVDPLTGLAICEGNSMKAAEEEFLRPEIITELEDMRRSKKYESYMTKYNELLSEKSKKVLYS